MRTSKSVCSSILLLFFFGCNNDLHLGMVYQKKLITQKGVTEIYSYHLGWAIDAEAYYLSANKEVCMGFDSTKDICFGAGGSHIYYEINDDTLKVYSNYIPPLPNKFPMNIKALKLDLVEGDQYEDKFKKGKINKVNFDTIFIEIPCKVVPYSSARNMKFRTK